MIEDEKGKTARRAIYPYLLERNNINIPVSWTKQQTKHLTAVAWAKKITKQTKAVSRTKQPDETEEDTGIQPVRNGEKL